MGSVLLVIHLMTAIFLVALILMQRSGGGALNGLGGGSGANSFLSARGTGNLLTRLTAILATVFFITSIALSLYYKGAMRPSSSVVETAPVSSQAPSVPTVPLGK
ncbi:MAG: preprotein translocase subunit SecG [Alphaproteobacteria bacterium]|nr:preprotein translocase subunit SecG [Alphaproteobacteria bacterium]